jgi:hypothetical protein
MNTQYLITFAPFLAVLFVLFAMLQVLRKQRQGVGAALLAFTALVAPLAALILIQDATVRSSLVNNLALNAIVVFVGSILILVIERRKPMRTANRSYGRLGVGLGVMIAILALTYPILISATVVAQTANLDGVNITRADTSTIQNVSQTSDIYTQSSSAFSEVLSVQTGLTSEELTTQLQSGNSVADLVTVHNGDPDVVITAAATAIDDLKTQGGMPAQMLVNLGEDTSEVATQYVQGELDERAQLFLTSLLVSGGMPSFPQNGQNPPPDANGTPIALPNQADAASVLTGQFASVPTAESTQSIATPTEVTIRPTLISFPSATPTPLPTQVSAEATQETSTCTVTPIYNLNLRDQPNTNGAIYLSIPFGTPVMATGRTASDWYSVTYNGQPGWVSGEYLSVVSDCADLVIVETNS